MFAVAVTLNGDRQKCIRNDRLTKVGEYLSTKKV